MNSTGDKKTGEPTPASNSQELFEEIFKQATMEIRIEKSGKAQSQEYTPVLAPGRWQQQQKLKDAEKRVFKPSAPASRKSEKANGSFPGNTVKTQPALKPTGEMRKSTPPARSLPKNDKRKVKRSVAPKAVVLLILLAILAAISSNYLGIWDVRILLDYFKFDHEGKVAQASAPRKQSMPPVEKIIGAPRQPQEMKQNPVTNRDEIKASSPAAVESSPPTATKEDKLAALETPSTMVQAKSGMERVEEKAPSSSTNERTDVHKLAAKQESNEEPVQIELSSKPDAPEFAPSQLIMPKYPYSVYLGSFKAADAVKKAMSEYQEEGLSPYWVKVDLGEKGVWFRFFAGHFQTKAEAAKFIRDHNIKGATAEITRYANLIGIYSSDKGVEDTRRALVSAGFYPYVIQGVDGKSLLYSGAFDRKDYAEKERTLLASKGIKSEIVER